MRQVRFLSLAATMTGFSLLAACSDDTEPIVIPPNESGLIEINGGGASYPNSVFVSLRSGKQTAVARSSWDLAFSTGSDFKVLINGTTGAMATATAKTDINAVGAAEIAEVEESGELILSFSNLEGILHVDDVANPLSKPVIGTVSATEANNAVYLLSRGASGVDAKPLKKIRILRNGDGYKLQHADADATTFNTLNISKDKDDNFIYINFESGIVEVEPAKTEWDISWTASTSSTPYPEAANGVLAYYFQDLVFHNIYGGVTVAEVMEEDVAYEAFAEQNAARLNFNSDSRLAIGSNWRSGGGPSSAPAVRDDRYYVVKDSESNIYKLRFLSLNKAGERGRPSFEYELVKSGK